MDRIQSISFLVIFILSIKINNVHTAFDKGIEGRLTPCQNEGEPIPVDDIDKHRCFSCICKNGFVECRDSCPRIDDCHMMVEDGCCKRCRGCKYKNEYYASHTEWTDPNDPCTVFRCEAGVVTQSNLHCHTPCSDPKPPEKGKCCPTCSECKINGQIAYENQDVISDDPCLQCRCHNGRMVCSKKACPVLQCVHSYLPPGECCPRCNGTRMLLHPPNTCVIQKQFLYEDEHYDLDVCTKCACLNETAVCKRNSCPILECAPELQKSVPGSCCKKCVMPVEEVRSQCWHDSKVYEDGQSLQLDACKSCKCQRGMLSCAMTKCNVTLPCAPGTRKVIVPGECCPKCEEVDGVCMVFGDPHYKTFDGKIYSFKGIGKYQLTADCLNNTFSIRVANTAVNRFSSSSTKRVAIKFGTTRINLQQKGRVKYNGNRIQYHPPYISSDVRIERIQHDNILVTLENGVKLIWNGHSFLEVSVPAKYKNKLCGLCGNFNSFVQDDMRTRQGVIVRDNETTNFGVSWCVGKRSECEKKVKPLSQKACMKRSTRNRCHLFVNNNSHVFGNCYLKLNNMKYYSACKMDMCNCANKKCYCESMIAYARECERLGGKLLPNWQKVLKCEGSTSGKKKKIMFHKPIIKSSTPHPLLLKFRKNFTTTLLHFNRSSKSPIPLV